MKKKFEIPSIITDIFLFVAGFIIFQLLFGYIIAERLVQNMTVNQKAVALSITSMATSTAYFMSWFIFILIPDNFKSQKIWKRVLLFLTIYLVCWVGYIMAA
jgi:hypothetical protein